MIRAPNTPPAAISIRPFCLTILLVLSLLTPNLSWSQSTAPSAAPASKSPVDALIPWLLQEGNELRGIPFSEVILAATGKRVLPIDPKNETDQRVIKQITGVLDDVMRRLNAPDSVIQGIPRINEVSSHFEDSMRELLNTTPGLSCDFPRTVEDRIQRSGISRPSPRRSKDEARFLPRSETLCSRQSRKQFPYILFRTEKRDQ